MYKYKNTDDEIKVGDVFTDGSLGLEDVRLKNRAKVLYVDKYHLIWFPLNEFTRHRGSNTSKSWCLSCEPIKVKLSNLSEEELEKEIMDKLKNLLHELRCDIAAIPKTENNKLELNDANETLKKAWNELSRLSDNVKFK